ncbi:MAG: signal peptidase I [Coriobacteriales bacterium]|nr:signal peptidase I [Coriobacteriales bacterium]
MTDDGLVRARPTAEQIEAELGRRNRKIRAIRMLASTVGSLLVIAAVVVLLATFAFPTFTIYGDSMAPVFHEGEVVVSVKSSTYQTGDIVAFYYNNKILVKRVICCPGEWFNMQEDGTVFVNGNALDEPYVSEEGFGSCDLTLPYQVPADRYFVMGDKRASSIDSRMTQLGCVPDERIVGKICLRVWPLDAIGFVG